MPCDEFESALHEGLDRGCLPPEDPLWAEHVASCSACRGKLHAWQAMIEATERLPSPRPTTDLAARVIGELHAVSRPEQRWYASVPSWAALAASLLFAAWGGYLLARYEQRHPPVPMTVASQPPQTLPTPSNEPWVIDPRLLLPQLVQWSPTTASSPTTTGPMGTPRPTTTGAVSSLSEARTSLAPVAQSATTALDNLWQALSLPSEENQS